MSDTTLSYNETFAQAIQREFLPLRNAAKLLARKSGASPRAAKNWLAGTHAPSLNSLVPILANSDALLAEFLQLIEEHKSKC